MCGSEAAGSGHSGCDASGYGRIYALPEDPGEASLSHPDAHREGGRYGQNHRPYPGGGRLYYKALQSFGVGSAGKDPAAALHPLQPKQRLWRGDPPGVRHSGTTDFQSQS